MKNEVIKWKVSIIELIVQGIALVVLFLPGMYTREQWKPSTWGYTLMFDYSTSFFSIAFENIGYLVIGVMILNVILLLLNIFKATKVTVAQIIVPIATIVAMLVFTFLVGYKDDYGYCASISWLFYVEMLLLISISVISFINYKNPYIEFLSKQPSYKENTINVPLSHADEISKYKKLLDDGVISQEEFETKKKQLLGL